MSREEHLHHSFGTTSYIASQGHSLVLSEPTGHYFQWGVTEKPNKQQGGYKQWENFLQAYLDQVHQLLHFHQAGLNANTGKGLKSRIVIHDIKQFQITPWFNQKHRIIKEKKFMIQSEM